MFIVIFWITMTFGFVAEELLPVLEPLRPMVFLLADGLALLLGVATIRQKGDLLVLVSYAAIAFLSTVVINHGSMMQLLNGSRDFIGLLFMIPALRYFLTSRHSEEFRLSFDKQLRIWLWLQAVCITWQFIRYGANDHGGGSMGYGSSGIVSMLIYLVSFYLITRHWNADSYWESLRRNKEYVFLLFPTFLNETKASFIMLVIYFLLLVKVDRKFVIRMAVGVPVGIVAFIGVGMMYFNITGQKAEEVLSEEFFTNYFYGEDLDFLVEVGLMLQDDEIEVDPEQWWVNDIPRFAKIALVIPILKNDTAGGVWWGAGVGQFKGSSVVGLTKFASKNQWLMFGSKVMIFFMLVQLGIIGLIWFIIVITRDLFPRKGSLPYSLQVQLFITADMLLIYLYNDSIRVLAFCMVFFYLSLAMQPLHERIMGNQSADGNRRTRSALFVSDK